MATSMDSLVAPLPACSLETIPLPIELRNGSRIWPLMLSCYQLQEDRQSRRGQINFFAVSCRKRGNETLQFEPNHQTVLTPSDSSGILDGKWALDSCSKSLFSHEDGCYYFASAHSSGEIRIHSLQTDMGDNGEGECSTRIQSPYYKIDPVCQSEPPSRDGSPLCLSLNWSSGRGQHRNSQHEQQLVSTYSDGRVAIHTVTTKPQVSLSLSSSSSSLPPEMVLEERHSWLAHSLFRDCQAEVWSADFAGADDQWIVSCADDAKLKVWDARALCTSPVSVSSVFSAGTTCAAKHPRKEHIMACGSYDETVALFDVRMMFSRPLVQFNAGGGIWRLKWHPLRDDVLLVAAMHGGCRVLQMDTLGDDEWSLHVDQEFTLHESMAYGADWLVDSKDGLEAAASCSFYDQAVHLWSTQKR